MWYSVFWKVILHILVGYGAFMAGTFGFAQIVGSLQNLKSRGMKLTIFTIALHTCLLGVLAFLVLRFIPQYKTFFLVGYIISLIAILRAGKIS